MSQPPGDPQGWHFAPATVAVRVGGTVTWTNPAGNEIHTVTADGGAFDSGVLSAGDTFQQTFTAPGTVAYHCTLHAWMKGEITVVG
jgi:plastocyanin